MSEKPSGRASGPAPLPIGRAVEAPLGGHGRIGRARLVRDAGSLMVVAVGVACLVAYQTWEPELEVSDAVDVPAPVPPVELPIEVNARVVKWMRRYVTDEKETFQTFLAREGRFAGLIRAKLRARGMPEDLLYLAMIESGFSPKATSTVAAAGVWQFMRPTARQFGLRLDHWVDERRDPVRATDAALDYLEWLHHLSGLRAPVRFFDDPQLIRRIEPAAQRLIYDLRVRRGCRASLSLPGSRGGTILFHSLSQSQHDRFLCLRPTLIL